MSIAEQLSPADARWGFTFGCDGLMSLEEACDFLGGISVDTLDNRARDGLIRKGKHPNGLRKAVVCRRSVVEFAATMEI